MTARSGPQLAGRISPVLLAAVALLGVPRPVVAADERGPADVYVPGKVWQVHVTLSAEEFAAMQPRGGFTFGAPPKEPPKPADPKREVHRNTFGVDLPWASGSVVIGGENFEKVAIRYKGNGTIGDAARSVKKSLKIDLDRLGGSGQFGGSSSINLHCGVADPSKFRETLGYEIYRAAGVPAPRTVLAEVRLTVPGKHDRQLLGLYTIVEEVDKAFLKDRFGSNNGLLMKPEGVREFEDRGDTWDRYKAQYKPKREPTKAEADRLIAFARLVHKADDATFAKEIESYLDADAYLRFMAATAFVANTDSFFVLGHNYCLYLHPKTNKLHFVPWDLDRAFSNLPILGSNNQQMNLSLTHPYGGTHRLTDRLLAVPGVAERYQKLLKELSATAFEKGRLLKQLAAAEGAMRELIDRDAKAAAERKDGGGAFGPLWMFGTPPTLKTFVEKRTASVAAQVAGTSTGFVPAAGIAFGAPPQVGVFMAPPMMEAMDRNRDEHLSRDEWLGGVKRLFNACAKDKDGKVDRKALVAGVKAQLPETPGGMPPGPFDLGDFMAGAILGRADGDKDGKLTSADLLAAAGAAFDEFDKKKAGKLDEDTFAELLTKVFAFPKFTPPPKQKEKEKEKEKDRK
jgi:spore coat protein CotH